MPVPCSYDLHRGAHHPQCEWAVVRETAANQEAVAEKKTATDQEEGVELESDAQQKSDAGRQRAACAAGGPSPAQRLRCELLYEPRGLGPKAASHVLPTGKRSNCPCVGTPVLLPSAQPLRPGHRPAVAQASGTGDGGGPPGGQA